MADNPPTQKQQIENFLQLAGSPDFAAATHAFENWKIGNENWAAVTALFPGITGGLEGITAEINSLREKANHVANFETALNEIFAALDVKESAAAKNKITEMISAGADRASLFKLLGDNVTDMASASSAVNNLKTGFDAEVTKRIAAAGVTAPINKDVKTVAGEGANVLTRAEFNTLSPAAQLDFSRKNGRITD